MFKTILLYRFYIEVTILVKERRITRVKGRHFAAKTFKMRSQYQFGSIFDYFEIGNLPTELRASLDDKNRLVIWDEQSEHCAFEIDCDLSNMFACLKNNKIKT